MLSSLGNILPGTKDSKSVDTLPPSTTTTTPAATETVPPAVAQKANILTAFTGLDLVLGGGNDSVPSGNSDTASQPHPVSASRELLRVRKMEKTDAMLHDVDFHVKKFQLQTNTVPAASALDQAMASYKNDTENLDVSIRKKGRKAVLSKKARKRKDSNKRRGENYDSQFEMKSAMGARRKQRRERLKHIY